MSVLSVQAPRRFAPAAPFLRFGGTVDGATEWLLKRNCSISPRQLLGVFLTLCAVSLAIGAAFWSHGATLILPFAGAELCALAVALAVYARHAADQEKIVLRPDRLTVECSLGHRVIRVEFVPSWVRIEPAAGQGSLIELSGEGKRVAVGRFVRPELRRALADELRTALRRSSSACAPLDDTPLPPARRTPESES
ncbi:MAG: DUF2244 domain-containing protein [Caldimonas sp.]